jgi:dienelactone hydrolase
VVSRRTLLLGGLGTVVLAGTGGYAAVEERLIPGRQTLARVTGRCDVDATPPSVAGPVVSGSFTSSARRTSVGWSYATPPGIAPDGLPVALVLHGRGDDHSTAFTALKWHAFLAAHVAAGGRPIALAAADGGATYWHRRADGDDPIAMLTDEFLPLLARHGMRTDRVAAAGWSMGGYGALLLARQSHRAQLDGTSIVAAAASSPALFPSFHASAPGAFDDGADYDRFGTLAAQPDVGAIPTFVACGADDAFAPEASRYRSHVSPTPAGGISRGCHTAGFWRSVAADQIAFVAGHLG